MQGTPREFSRKAEHVFLVSRDKEMKLDNNIEEILPDEESDSTRNIMV